MKRARSAANKWMRVGAVAVADVGADADADALIFFFAGGGWTRGSASRDADSRMGPFPAAARDSGSDSSSEAASDFLFPLGVFPPFLAEDKEEPVAASDAAALARGELDEDEHEDDGVGFDGRVVGAMI